MQILNRIGRLFGLGELSRGVALIASGAALAQLVNLAAAPIITRLYSPKDFGIYSSMLAIVSFVSISSALRYELGITVAESDRDARGLGRIASVLVLITSVLIFLTIGVISTTAWWPRELAIAGPMALAIPVACASMAFQQIAYYTALRARQHGLIGSSRIAQTAFTVGIQLAFAAFGWVSLVVSTIFGSLAAYLLLAARVRVLTDSLRYSRSELKNIARKYKQFPLYSTFDGLVNTGAIVLPTVVIARFYGLAEAGIFALAYKVLSAPLGIAGMAVGQVFLAEASIFARNGTLGREYLSLCRKLLQVVCLPVVYIACFAPELFHLIFGESWRSAGELARWMVIWMGAQLVASPLSVVYIAVNKQRQGLIYQCLYLSLRVVALFIGVKLNSIQQAVILLSVISLATYVGMMAWTNLLTGNSGRELLVALVFEAAWIGIYALGVAAIAKFVNGLYLPATCLGWLVILLVTRYLHSKRTQRRTSPC